MGPVPAPTYWLGAQQEPTAQPTGPCPNVKERHIFDIVPWEFRRQLPARLLQRRLKGATARPVSMCCRLGLGHRLAPPPHQPSPGGSTSATPPQGGSDTRYEPGTSFTPWTGNMVYITAKESGKKPCAGLKYHSPLEGESARPGRSPQSSRWGDNAPPHLAESGSVDQPGV